MPVRQTHPQGCWAASFQMWCRASGFRWELGESELFSLFANMRGYLNASQAATRRGVTNVMYLAHMAIETVRGAELNAKYLGEKLEQGYVYLAYTPAYDGGDSGHVVVVYGVEPGAVLVVDPGSSLTTVRIPEDWLMSRTSAIVGVPLLGPPTNPFLGMTSGH